MGEKFEKFKTKLRSVGEFLFEPHCCIFCRRECDTTNGRRICPRCEELIRYNGEHFCLKCGNRIGLDYEYCVSCQATSYDFDYARSLFLYDEVTAPMILNFKYNGYRDYKKPLAKMLSTYYDTSDIVASVVTSVPMPKKREKQRGYNQAKELALEFCALQNMPYFDFLERTKENVKQATLSAKERRENIRGSFKAINKAALKNKDVLLIDDVLTTGATASECARVMKEAGARSVVVFTLAKTDSNRIGTEA